MSQIADHLNRLAERGEHRNVDDVIAQLRMSIDHQTTSEETEMAEILTPALPSNRAATRSHLMYAAVVLAFVGVVGVIALSINRSDTAGTAPTGTPPTGTLTEVPSPDLTLPPVDDPGVPVTAESPNPHYSFRLSEDVEIGWSGVGNGPTLFCWRTPVVEDCGGEPSPGTNPIPVAVSPGQTVAIVAVGADGSMADDVFAHLVNGDVVGSPIKWREQPISIGYARFNVPAESVVAMSRSRDALDAATVGTRPGAGFGAIPEFCESAPPATYYLGGPASEQNLAADGFIYSQPAGSGAVELAREMVVTSVIGQGCGAENPANVTGSQNADGTVQVSAFPPAVPTAFTVDVSVAEVDGVVGVTQVAGSTTFDIADAGGVPTLTLTAGLPSDADSVTVRFKKGDDVWEISAEPNSGIAIELAVPEVDRFPESPVDWVMFTVGDRNNRVVGVGGMVL